MLITTYLCHEAKKDLKLKLSFLGDGKAAWALYENDE